MTVCLIGFPVSTGFGLLSMGFGAADQYNNPNGASGAQLGFDVYTEFLNLAAPKPFQLMHDGINHSVDYLFKNAE